MADEAGTPEEALAFEGDAGDPGLDVDAPADDSLAEDPELELIKARVKEMEEEAEKLKEMQSQVDKQMMSPKTPGPPTAPSFPTPEEKADADARSVYIGNVDYASTAEELEEHFHGCGSINRVTIMCDKHTGHPKGFAYIEFAEKDSAATAVSLDDTLFRGRQIKVCAKRTNFPGLSERGRGGGFRGRGRGGYPPRGGGGGITGYRMVPVYGGSPRGGGFGRSRFRGGNVDYPSDVYTSCDMHVMDGGHVYEYEGACASGVGHVAGISAADCCVYDVPPGICGYCGDPIGGCGCAYVNGYVPGAADMSKKKMKKKLKSERPKIKKVKKKPKWKNNGNDQQKKGKDQQKKEKNVTPEGPVKKNKIMNRPAQVKKEAITIKKERM